MAGCRGGGESKARLLEPTWISRVGDEAGAAKNSAVDAAVDLARQDAKPTTGQDDQAIPSSMPQLT
jgi:hypothetical protein